MTLTRKRKSTLTLSGQRHYGLLIIDLVLFLVNTMLGLYVDIYFLTEA